LAGHRQAFQQKQQSGGRFGQHYRASVAVGNPHQLAAQGNLTSQLTRIGKRRFCRISWACGVFKIAALVARLANRVIGGALGGWVISIKKYRGCNSFI